MRRQDGTAAPEPAAKGQFPSAEQGGGAPAQGEREAVADPLPVVVQSASKDMQCSIDADGAACHLLNDVAPRPGDIRGQCTGLSEYHGGYAVVTLDGGAQYGLCGNGTSPMEAEEVAGPAFPGTVDPGRPDGADRQHGVPAPGAMVRAPAPRARVHDQHGGLRTLVNASPVPDEPVADRLAGPAVTPWNTMKLRADQTGDRGLPMPLWLQGALETAQAAIISALLVLLPLWPSGRPPVSTAQLSTRWPASPARPGC